MSTATGMNGFGKLLSTVKNTHSPLEAGLPGRGKRFWSILCCRMAQESVLWTHLNIPT